MILELKEPPVVRDVSDPWNFAKDGKRYRRSATTADMIFRIDELIEVLSAGMTLEPGDILATGTPSGVAAGFDPPRWLAVGDVVEAEVEGIGILRNWIVAPGK